MKIEIPFLFDLQIRSVARTLAESRARRFRLGKRWMAKSSEARQIRIKRSRWLGEQTMATHPLRHATIELGLPSIPYPSLLPDHRESSWRQHWSSDRPQLSPRDRADRDRIDDAIRLAVSWC